MFIGRILSTFQPYIPPLSGIPARIQPAFTALQSVATFFTSGIRSCIRQVEKLKPDPSFQINKIFSYFSPSPKPPQIEIKKELPTPPKAKTPIPVVTMPPPKKLAPPKSTTSLLGLPNIGNTCYLASLAQAALIENPKFLQAVAIAVTNLKARLEDKTKTLIDTQNEVAKRSQTFEEAKKSLGSKPEFETISQQASQNYKARLEEIKTEQKKLQTQKEALIARGGKNHAELKELDNLLKKTAEEKTTLQNQSQLLKAIKPQPSLLRRASKYLSFSKESSATFSIEAELETLVPLWKKVKEDQIRKEDLECHQQQLQGLQQLQVFLIQYAEAQKSKKDAPSIEYLRHAFHLIQGTPVSTAQQDPTEVFHTFLNAIKTFNPDCLYSYKIKEIALYQSSDNTYFIPSLFSPLTHGTFLLHLPPKAEGQKGFDFQTVLTSEFEQIEDPTYARKNPLHKEDKEGNLSAATKRYFTYLLESLATECCFSIVRFNNEGCKIPGAITNIPTLFELGPEYFEDGSTTATFRLIGIVFHHGSSIQSGHYTAIRATKNSKDQTCYGVANDSIITPKTRAEILDYSNSHDAYMIFYNVTLHKDS